MKKALLPLLLVATAAAMFGCQTMPYQPYAREVKKRPGDGGQIALKTEHRDEDRQKATMLMNSNCGTKAVKVLEEGEVVTGTATNATQQARDVRGQQGQQVGTLFGMPVVSGAQAGGTDSSVSSTTTQLKEWQIVYECDKMVATETAPGVVPAKATTGTAPMKKKTSKQ